MPRRYLPRPHVNKVPLKYYFRAQDICVLLPGFIDLTGKLAVVWKRGHRKTMTSAFPIKEELSSIDGSITRTATTLEDLALVCTMFKSARSGTFESKLATFTLREEMPDGDERKLCSATIDLSAYATPDISADPVELSFMEGKAVLKMTLSSHWLKNMRGGADDDDDDASIHSFGSFNSSVPPIEEEEGSSSGAPPRPGRLAPAAAPGVAPPTAAALAGGSRAARYTPMAPAERARMTAQREAAIEQRWAEEESKVRDADAREGLLEELQQVREELSGSRQEAKYWRAREERLRAENRVLRREQRGGRRDDVVTQLEVELQMKEQERAEMEESLSAAFSGVAKEMQERINGLAAERDRLLVQREETTGRKGGFLTK